MFDLHAHLAEKSAKRSASAAADLVSRFGEACLQNPVDNQILFSSADLVSRFGEACLSWSTRDRNRARRHYQRQVEKLDLKLPTLLDHSEWPKLLLAGWLAIEVVFKLRTPWYSKDDRPFHVLDNPVRKDRVFGLPFMSAASWKGLLRWACRMEDGLLEHLAEHEGRLDGWKEPSWILHLFGNGKEEDEIFSRGALHCFPTWFNKIGFEVINPHDRARRAGTQPILYEVVPASTSGTLSLLYAPMPGQARRQGVVPTEVLDRLLPALEKLLTRYGFSAKRTAGWGVAQIESWKLCAQGLADPEETKTLAEAKTLLAKLLGEGKGKQ